MTSENAKCEARQALDAAIAVALPLSGGRVQVLLEKLRSELDRVDTRVPTCGLTSLDGFVVVPDHWNR